MTEYMIYFDSNMLQYVFFALGLLAVFVNFFTKHVAVSGAIIFLMIATMLSPGANTWLQYAAIVLMIGGIFGLIKYGFKGVN